jgi:protein-export membrane protein SecD
MLHFSPLKIWSIVFVCVFAILFSLPNFVDSNKKNLPPYNLLPSNKVNLGLDLRGGSHILLQIDFDYYIQEQLKSLQNELKREFIEKRVYTLPMIEGSKIIASLRDESAVKKVKKIVRRFDSDIEVEYESGSVKLFYSDKKRVKMQQDLVAQSIEIVRRRVDETGTKEPVIQARGNNQILLQMPGVNNPEEIKDLLGKTAKLTFHFVVDQAVVDSGVIGKYFDYDVKRLPDSQGRYYLIKTPVILSGEMLIDANATYYEGEPAVAFRFNSVGTRKFAEITAENVGRVFAVVLDGKIVTAPKINSIISGGAGVISGSFTTQEAKQVALLLRAGALPAPLEVIEERTVGPSLGADSIRAGTTAALYGFGLVALFMIIFYRFFGLIANFALIINISLILTALSLLGATLTLPGIAGIVLTMGMAVDSNVLIFERIKEEVRGNKKMLSSIDAGFSQAFRTIIDSNITTLIIALFLYIFGSGPVRGFAVTLSIGILASMFSAILLTRMMIVFWIKYRSKRYPIQSLPI